MLIALTSLKGSPGVTTVTVALAAQWPGAGAHRLVAECDPAGGDLAMWFGLPPSPGLASLAAAARRDRDPAMVWEHSQALPGGASVVSAPSAGRHARSALHTLATAPGGPLLDEVARAPGVIVLADCGRMDPGSPAEAIARRADALVLVTGTHGDDLAHVAGCLDELARWTPRPALLLIGQGYATAEIERELGVPAIGRVPHDPVAAAALAGHRPPSRKVGGLTRAAVALARTLAAPPIRTSPNPVAEGSSLVPGVPAQQVHPTGVHVVRPRRHTPLKTSTSPTADPQSNGERPSSPSGREQQR